MKIELPNGLTIHCESVEEFQTVLPLLRPGDPDPAPRMASEEEAVRPGDTLSLFVKDEEMTAAPAPVQDDRDDDALRSRTRRPTEVYVTDIENRVLRLLRQHPEGLTSPQIARHLDVTVSKASVTAWRLRAERPFRDTTTPLVTKVTDGRHRITPLGRSLRLIVVKRPNHDNAKLGWAN